MQSRKEFKLLIRFYCEQVYQAFPKKRIKYFIIFVIHHLNMFFFMGNSNARV